MAVSMTLPVSKQFMVLEFWIERHLVYKGFDDGL